MQSPEDFSRDLQARWQGAAAGPTPEVLALLTPASRDLVEGFVRRGQWPDLRQRVIDALVDARVQEGTEETPNRALRRQEGPVLWLVRDGWGWRLDLLLSDGVWFPGGPGDSYSCPW